MKPPLRIFLADLTYDTIAISTEAMPLNIGYIASYCIKKFGSDVEISLFKYISDLEKALEENPPDILGMSNYCWSQNVSLEMFKICKEKNPHSLRVWGGPNFPIDLPSQELFLNNAPEVDIYVPIDGEVGFSNVVDCALKSNSKENIRTCVLSSHLEGCVIKNPQGKHSLGVGILNKLNLIFEGSLGYFGIGSCDGPTVRINGRVGWSCAENLMAGKVVIEKNAGSCFGAAIRGGDLICKGSVGARTGIDMKGGTIIIGGDAGAFTGFMMQRGRIIILGNVGINLGDSMYDGTIFVGGEIGSYGSDAVDAELTKSDQDWLKRKLKVAEIGENFDVSKMKKIVAGKKLWNYDNLEPTEKKGAI